MLINLLLTVIMSLMQYNRLRRSHINKIRRYLARFWRHQRMSTHEIQAPPKILAADPRKIALQTCRAYPAPDPRRIARPQLLRRPAPLLVRRVASSPGLSSVDTWRGSGISWSGT